MFNKIIFSHTRYQTFLYLRHTGKGMTASPSKYSAPASKYSAPPTITKYSVPAPVSKYTAPVVTKYTAPAMPQVSLVPALPQYPIYVPPPKTSVPSVQIHHQHKRFQVTKILLMNQIRFFIYFL